MSDRVYTRIGYIAKGGSSKVYKVMAANSRVFALKCVSLQKADQATIEGYINEVRLLCKLQDNPWIIRLWDYELSNSALNLLMEYGETDLAKLLYQQQNRPFSINFIRHYWVQMLEAVQTIHNEKIVHTDLKPANFVLVEGSLKLIDFGIANMIANDTTNIQREGHVGTANYMAPEAITSNPGSDVRKIGRASDVWSLGCILYQMVYGGTPFSDILHLFQKLSAIADPNWKIPFPELTLSPLNQSQDQDQQQPQQPPLQSLQLQQQQQRLQQQLRQAQQQRLQQPLPASGAEGMAGIAQELKTHQVGQDLIRVMKGCLQRDPKNRMTIPELLQDPLLQPTQRARHSSSLLANGSHSHGPDSDSDEVQLDMRLLTRIMQATIDFGKETCRTSNGGGQGETGSTSTLTSSGNPGWPDIRPDQLQAAARDLMDQMQIMLVRRRRAEAKSLDQDNESGIGGSIPDDSSEMIDSLRIRL
ncbi:Dual-specificity kinase, spindle pole body (SPB) duplication and spindle checkpoint function [Lunasporangiospora selenospora]|uniref:Dual-specificity kinase, spindle pole body (SPB) duplication and spindle checkpoint function n=1 Tax=Lunasporangiospora selenospora TaxID=979761 RepID=A0A9P6KFC5_9FUNG|nr:Dual-specificity kinase, spindle pole body (SPB) duplication and spindle checkpoint function [Lunasporangiospora selenospora]